MADNICLVDIDADKMEEKVQKILRQTDYTEKVAKEKLSEYNFNEISVIRAYLGISYKPPQAKSINQEIYTQLRHKMDSNMRDYNVRVAKGEVKKVV